MKIAIMQPYFLPYIGYWQLIGAVDTFVIFDDVNFRKKSYIYRNYILSNGVSSQINLELLGASQNKLINEIEISFNFDKLIKTIYHNYNKSPFFDEVFPVIRNFLFYKEKNLSKFLGYSLLNLSKYLEINTNFVYSSDIDKDDNNKGQKKIIDICKILNATNYLNPINGINLYSKEKFSENDIKLNFLETKSFKYNQFKNKFVPYLSIIDILMFNDKQEIRKLLQNYKLK